MGAPELVFPSSPVHSLRKFRFAYYFRDPVERRELNFSNEGVEYRVFDYFDADERPMVVRGVAVADGRKKHEFLCRVGGISNLAELEKLVPCDIENARASCK